MDLALLALAFVVGLLSGAFATAVAALTFLKLSPPEEEVRAAAPPAVPAQLYKPVDKSDRAVARAEKRARTAGDVANSTTTFEMQAGPQ